MFSGCLNSLRQFKDSMSLLTPGQPVVAVRELLPSSPRLAISCLTGFLSPAACSSGNKWTFSPSSFCWINVRNSYSPSAWVPLGRKRRVFICKRKASCQSIGKMHLAVSFMSSVCPIPKPDLYENTCEKLTLLVFWRSIYFISLSVVAVLFLCN